MLYRIAIAIALLMMFGPHAMPACADPPAPTVSPNTIERISPPRTITVDEAERLRTELERKVFTAFAKSDHAAAEAALRELIPLDADNFVHWYNLACALAMQGRVDEAVKMLQQSIAHGFADLRQLQTDPNLNSVRPLESYKTIVSGWDQFLDRRIDTTLDQARLVFGGEGSSARYAIEKDETLRLAYVTAFDPTLFKQSKEEIARLTSCWNALVLPADEPLRTGGAPDRKPPWVLVILPARSDYARWASRRFGENWQNIGGNYSHDSKQLVAQDLGATVRHEYWHVLHWRHMDQLGQRHPIWIMEGLCSLVEDIEPDGDSSFRALPSWRTNMARRLNKGGMLTPWDVLFAMDQKRFIASRPLAYYAQARAIFVYLSVRGKLRTWYTEYVRAFDEDPTGRIAFERAFERPLKETERDFRAWLRELPDVAEVVGQGEANLPFDIGPGTGDGPTIDSLPTGKARDAGFRMRDVITAINGTPVRDLNDLARVLGELQPGAIVEIAYRRGGKHGAAKIALIPPK